MCIYYTGKQRLHYNTEEHVIPAALGGMQKLSKGVVSDEFNRDISKLEQRFIRNSLISLPRQLYGPGKRGRLSEVHATKSKISLLHNRNTEDCFGLGYVKMGVPYEIPHVVLNTKTGQLSFSFNNDKEKSHETIMQEFAKSCSIPNALKIKTIVSNELPDSLILFGIQAGIEEHYTAYIVRNSINGFDLDETVIARIGQSLKIDKLKSEATRYTPTIHQQVDFHEDYLRVYAKIALNTLAHLKGKEFVLHPALDEIRNWVSYGGENHFVTLNTGKGTSTLSVPKNAHVVVITKFEGLLIGHVSLYEGLDTLIMLSRRFPLDFSLNGFICDWQQKKEYGLFEYLSENVQGN